MSLSEFLKSRGHTELAEGHCGSVPKQMEHLREIVRNPRIKTMLEIGFNAGHSADVFLSENPNLHLTSYDLGTHVYGPVGKEYIDATYPGRHTIMLGDSRETLPKNNSKYDCFFIDGGHEYDVALSDMKNCARLANPYAVVIFDDIVYKIPAEYTEGPTKVWDESVNNGLVHHVYNAEYGPGLGMAVGVFTPAPVQKAGFRTKTKKNYIKKNKYHS